MLTFVTGFRKAVSASVLALWAVPFAVLATLPETGVQAFFGSMAALYALGFLAVVASWFWGRWFAQGLGWWGLMAGISLMFMGGVHPILLAFTVSHGAVLALMRGPELVMQYEGNPRWREKWQLDERAVHRIGGLVTNLGSLLPMIAFYAFFPRGGGAGESVALVLAAAGLVGVVRMRTWGLLAIAASGVVLVSSAATSSVCGGGFVGVAIGALLILATLRFSPYVVRWFRA